MDNIEVGMEYKNCRTSYRVLKQIRGHVTPNTILFCSRLPVRNGHTCFPTQWLRSALATATRSSYAQRRFLREPCFGDRSPRTRSSVGPTRRVWGTNRIDGAQDTVSRVLSPIIVQPEIVEFRKKKRVRHPFRSKFNDDTVHRGYTKRFAGHVLCCTSTVGTMCLYARVSLKPHPRTPRDTGSK